MILCLAFLSIGLGYAVLQSGGVVLSDWSVSLLIIGVGGLVYLSRPSFSDAQSSKTLRPFGLLLPCYVALQLVPLPLSLLRILSPARAWVLDAFPSVTNPIRFAALTVSSEDTFAYLFRIIAYTLTFFVIRDITRQNVKQRPWLPVFPLISIAAIEAGLALWQNAQSIEVEGTYANRNHLAGLLEMVIPLCLACGFALCTSALRYRTVQGRRLLQACVVLALGLTMFVALMSSLSKMGFAAGLAGVFVMVFMAVATRLRTWRKWLVLACIAALFLFVFIFLPPDELVDRFAGVLSGQQPAAEGRGPIGRDTLHLIAAYPLLGCGLGTYGTAFLKYQTSIVDFAFTYAHNDYLQLTAELGVLGFLLLGVLLGPVVVSAFHAAGGKGQTCYLGLGCAGAFTAIGLHSLTDFNLYIPANALLLVWILGIAAGLSGDARSAEPVPGRSVHRRFEIVLAVLLVFYAPAWILFERLYRSDSRIEAAFCRFGICDTDEVVAAETLDRAGKIADVPAAQLLLALKRDPNSPDRWCDTGESWLRSGHIAKAKFCFSKAAELGPNIPTVRMRVSDFDYRNHDIAGALQQRSRVLKATETYDNLIFDWYTEKKIPVNDVLVNGLPEDRRALQAYLRYLMNAGRLRDAMTAWRAVSSRKYADDRLAGEYVRMLYDAQMDEAAARSWADYLGPRRNGYLESNWIFNGDFESELSTSVFDWRIDQRNDVEVTRDASVAHTGAHSLRIRFGGQDNVNYNETSQAAFVRPGTYRFEAFVRTEGITTDEGVGFRILDPEAAGRTDITTERFTGNNDWHKVERMVSVSSGARLLQIRIVRKASLKFDNRISGTAWIDSVRLSPVHSAPEQAARLVK